MTVEAPPIEVQQLVPFALREFVARVGRASWPGDTVATSWYRSPQRNSLVRGATFSQHLAGLGLDVVTNDLRGAVAAARSVGLVAVNEGDHVHIQLLPPGVFGRWVQSLPPDLSTVFGHPVVRV